MRYNKYEESPYKGMYINIARWCNQPSFFKKKSFRNFCETNQKFTKTDNLCATMRYMNNFESKFPKIAKEYFDIKFEELNQYI